MNLHKNDRKLMFLCFLALSKRIVALENRKRLQKSPENPSTSASFCDDCLKHQFIWSLEIFVECLWNIFEILSCCYLRACGSYWTIDFCFSMTVATKSFLFSKTLDIITNSERVCSGIGQNYAESANRMLNTVCSI